MSRIGRYVEAILTGDNKNLPAPRSEDERELYNAAKKGHAFSWSDLGETTVMGDTLTWDGNTDGLYNAVEMFYHISNAVPTMQDLQNGGSYVSQGETIPFDSSMVADVGEGFLNVNSDVFIVTVANSEMQGIVFEKAGVYFADAGVGKTQVRSFTINNYNGFETTEITPIPTKYLPEHLQFGETTVMSDTLAWDGNTDGLYTPDGNYFLVSDATPTYSELINGGVLNLTVPSEGTSDIKLTSGFVSHKGTTVEPNYDILTIYYGMAKVVSEPNSVDGGVTFEKKGVYFGKTPDATVNSLKINGYKDFKTTTIKKIGPKYMPFGGVMRVNVTYDEVTEDMNFENVKIDKTFEEIILAHKNGYSIHAVINIGADFILPLVQASTEDGGENILFMLLVDLDGLSNINVSITQNGVSASMYQIITA